MKSVIVFAAVATISGFMLAGTTKPAEAAFCYYQLHQDGHGTGGLGVQGYGQAAKLENACDRARRECNRRFDRARKKGTLPRGGPRDFRCVRTSHS